LTAPKPVVTVKTTAEANSGVYVIMTKALLTNYYNGVTTVKKTAATVKKTTSTRKPITTVFGTPYRITVFVTQVKPTTLYITTDIDDNGR
jgi:hypothetical protein